MNKVDGEGIQVGGEIRERKEKLKERDGSLI